MIAGAVIGACTICLAIVALGSWGFAVFNHGMYGKEYTVGEHSDLSRICDGGIPGPTSSTPGPATCRWLFDWWHWPAVLTAGVLFLAVLTVLVARRHPRRGLEVLVVD